MLSVLSSPGDWLLRYIRTYFYHYAINDGRTVEIAQHLKFLGSTISCNLKWELNVVNIVKKAQQRLYFLRRLRSFGLTTQVMLNFYRAVIESVPILSITVWFGSIT